MEVPRLDKNRGFVGPEYYGCINSGSRPFILHCGYSGRYLVGPHLAVKELRSQILHDAVTGRGKRVYWAGDEGSVYAFKGRKAAVAKFNELCKAVTDWNREQRNQHKQDRKAAGQGDLGAALRLGDY